MTRSPVFSSFLRKGFAQPESLPQATAVSSSCQQLSSANAQGTVGFTRSELPWFGVKANSKNGAFHGSFVASPAAAVLSLFCPAERLQGTGLHRRCRRKALGFRGTFGVRDWGMGTGRVRTPEVRCSLLRNAPWTVASLGLIPRVLEKVLQGSHRCFGGAGFGGSLSLWRRFSSRVTPCGSTGVGTWCGKGRCVQRGRQGPDLGVSVPAALRGLQDAWPPWPRRIEHPVRLRTYASWTSQVLSEPLGGRQTCRDGPAHQPRGKVPPSGR